MLMLKIGVLSSLAISTSHPREEFVSVHDPSRIVLFQGSNGGGKAGVFSTHNGVTISTAPQQGAATASAFSPAIPPSVFTKTSSPKWISKHVPLAADNDLWAPDVLTVSNAANQTEHRLYYAVSSWGSQVSCIGLAVATATFGSAGDAGADAGADIPTFVDIGQPAMCSEKKRKTGT
eukprot:gene15234-12116_t